MKKENHIDSRLLNDVMSSCNIISGDRFLQHNLAIAKVAAEMVVQTLGPYGSTTVVDNGTGSCYPSKDGWTCLNNLRFTNPTYNALYTNLGVIAPGNSTELRRVKIGTTSGTSTVSHSSSSFETIGILLCLPSNSSGRAPKSSISILFLVINHNSINRQIYLIFFVIANNELQNFVTTLLAS